MTYAAAPTNNEWASFLRALGGEEEVNFWTPTSWNVRGLKAGDPFLFILHGPSPRRIAGYGSFVRYVNSSPAAAWNAFGVRNGVASERNLIERLASISQSKTRGHSDRTIGCIVLRRCIWWPEGSEPSTDDVGLDFPSQVVRLKYFEGRPNPLALPSAARASTTSLQAPTQREDDVVKRVPAASLQRIRRADLERAVGDFAEKRAPHAFDDSTQFDVLIDGHMRYPPKAIVGLAGRREFGRTLLPADFAGGESSTAFRLLWEHGYEIVTKHRMVGALDATFSVGRSKVRHFLIIESRGPDRNRQYDQGLLSILDGLATIDATLTDVYIDSDRTRELPLSQRRLVSPLLHYPLSLPLVSDLDALRHSITAACAATGRSVEKNAGGNPSKRLRLEFVLREELPLAELAALLAQGDERTAPTTRAFKFRPSEPQGPSDEGTRGAVGAVYVKRIHAQMQRVLYAALIARYGEKKVAAELITCCGRPADLIVELSDGYDIYEIKTDRAPRDCVRHALGQLLEYTCWPQSPRYKRMWVVGPSPIDATTEAYIATLRERFALPLGYLQQSPDNT